MNLVVKNKKNVMLLVLFFSMVVSSFSISDTVSADISGTINIDEDTFINSATPSANFGNDDFLELEGGSLVDTTIAFLRINFDSRVTSAEDLSYMNLYIEKDIVPANYDFQVFVVDGDWDENTLNWTNQPSLGQSIDPNNINNDVNYLIINLMDYYKGENSLSIAIKGDDSIDGEISLYTSDFEFDFHTKKPYISFRTEDNSSFENIPYLWYIFMVILIIGVSKFKKHRRYSYLAKDNPILITAETDGKCDYHLSKDAQYVCEACGKEICSDCKKVYREEPFVKHKGAPRYILSTYCPVCYYEEMNSKLGKDAKKSIIFGSILTGIMVIALISAVVSLGNSGAWVILPFPIFVCSIFIYVSMNMVLDGYHTLKKNPQRKQENDKKKQEFLDSLKNADQESSGIKGKEDGEDISKVSTTKPEQLKPSFGTMKGGIFVKRFYCIQCGHRLSSTATYCPNCLDSTDDELKVLKMQTDNFGEPMPKNMPFVNKVEYLKGYIPEGEKIILSAPLFFGPPFMKKFSDRIPTFGSLETNQDACWPTHGILTENGVYFVSTLNIPVFMDWTTVRIKGTRITDIRLKFACCLNLQKEKVSVDVINSFKQTCKQLKKSRDEMWKSQFPNLIERKSEIKEYQNKINRNLLKKGVQEKIETLHSTIMGEKLKSVISKVDKIEYQDILQFYQDTGTKSWISYAMFTKSGVAYFDGYQEPQFESWEGWKYNKMITLPKVKSNQLIKVFARKKLYPGSIGMKYFFPQGPWQSDMSDRRDLIEKYIKIIKDIRGEA